MNMKAEKLLPPFWVSEYEIPVPGMPIVVRVGATSPD
jgi:hypothetical protein